MKKKIKILMVGSDFSVKGGISSVVKQFIDYKWSDDIELKYIPTHIEGKAIIKFVYYIKALMKIIYYIILNKVDIIHIHMSHTGSFYRKYIIFKISKIFRKKILIHLHGSEFKKFYDKADGLSKILIKDMMKNSDKILVLGERWNDIINSIEPKSKTQVLLNTIKIPKDCIEFNTDNINILFLGSLVVRKGIYDLLKVIKALKNKNILNEYKIKFIIGGSGPEEKKVKEIIYEYDIEEYISLEGWVVGERKLELLKNSQIFVLPSYNEGLPVAILEAISYGIPTISTNVGSIDEAIVDNYNGFLIEPKDIEGLENALVKIIMNKEIWRKFNLNSRKMAIKKFNEEKYFDRIRDIYDELMI